MFDVHPGIWNFGIFVCRVTSETVFVSLKDSQLEGDLTIVLLYFQLSRSAKGNKHLSYLLEYNQASLL